MIASDVAECYRLCFRQDLIYLVNFRSDLEMIDNLEVSDSYPIILGISRSREIRQI